MQQRHSIPGPFSLRHWLLVENGKGNSVIIEVIRLETFMKWTLLLMCSVKYITGIYGSVFENDIKHRDR